MKCTHLYSFIILSFCSTFFDFMVLSDGKNIFPRDRIIHIFISCLLFSLFAVAVKKLDFKIGNLKSIILILIVSKLIFTTTHMVQYYQTYHASNIIGILIFTLVTAVITYDITDKKLSQLYIFLALGNIMMILMMVVLSWNKIDIANIYSNSLDFSFSFEKMPLFFEVITISAITNKGKERMYVQKIYLLITTFVLILVVVLQGLCINGNIMYSIAPMQSLFQIYSGKTIKRFDYIFTVLQSINYFATVILCTRAIKNIFDMETIVEKY